MAETLNNSSEQESTNNPLDKETLTQEAKRLREAYDHAFDVRLAKGHEQRHSDELVIFGKPENFIHFDGLGTERLHVIAGRKPHEHDDDPAAFESWEVVLTPENIVYASHIWQTGTVVDAEGKSKKAVQHSSPSTGIIEGTDAIRGADELLTHFKNAH